MEKTTSAVRPRARPRFAAPARAQIPLCAVFVSVALACAPAEESPQEPERCPQALSSPRTISEVVSHLNTLPKPVELPCFVETLPRPLAAHATRSTFSLQPSAGTRSPRIFLFLDPLIASLVPAGDGSALLEFGEMRSPTHTLKGELEFPVDDELTPIAPFERVFADDNSSCNVCHADPTAAEDIPFNTAFVSQALQPLPTDRVSLSSLQAEALACDAELEPYRCALLDALFNHGEVTERDFPATFAKFL